MDFAVFVSDCRKTVELLKLSFENRMGTHFDLMCQYENCAIEKNNIVRPPAGVAELADARDLKSRVRKGRAGSSPASGIFQAARQIPGILKIPGIFNGAFLILNRIAV